LYGIDSSAVGTVSVLEPQIDSFLDRQRTVFGYLNVVLILLGVAAVVTLITASIARLGNALLRSLTFTLLIWGCRYLFVLMDIPSSYLSGGIFDPAYYASAFGGGLAKSIGDLTLTSAALLLSTLVWLRHALSNYVPAGRWPRGIYGVLRWVAAASVAVLVFLLLRGFGAIVRSAVFDSSLKYTDPSLIIPSFELTLMVVNLFTISACLIVASVGLTSFLLSLLGGRRVAWVAASGLYVTCAVLFGAVQSHPLMDTEYRLIFGAGVLMYAGILRRTMPVGEVLTSPSSVLVLLGLSALLLYPQLDTRIRERDREHIEVFALEFVRPVDSWLRFAVKEALQSFGRDDVTRVLESGSPEETGRLALEIWARSSACREGYSCLFGIVDSRGEEISRFGIGNQNLPKVRWNAMDDAPYPGAVRVRQFGSGVNATKVYSGSVPIVSGGRTLARGYVVITAGQQTLFRGELPTFLRSTSPEDLRSFYRPVTVAEFRRGTLLASDPEIFPRRYALTETVTSTFADSTVTRFWGELTLGKERFEVLFVRGTEEEGQVIALCLPVQGTYWHLLNAVRMLIYYTLVVLIVLAVTLLIRWLSGKPYIPTFRDRLFVALLATAIVPLGVIAYYGKEFAEERMTEQTAGVLEQETGGVALQVSQALKEETRLIRSRQLDPATTEAIATAVDADFNVYIHNTLWATSRPELYAAGLLDGRLPGTVYAALVIEGERFFHQTENIGRFRYEVGYRAIYDEAGEVLAVVSVPTLYRQEELEAEILRQNAFLFGVYSFVLFAIVAVATTIASRIASPIHRLTEATRKVSQGDLDVTVGNEGIDGEIGELVRSFEAMTRDLKKQQQDLVRYERELAWKEMAKQVAHEIKNPLTPMKLSLQHLRQTYKDRVAHFDRIFEDVTKTVIDQIDTLSRIASEFSHFARMPKPTLEVCEINQIVGEALRLFEQEKRTTFEKVLGNGLPPIMADREELRRAFVNIIRNGIQAMGGSGRMVVRTERQNDAVCVRFRDFGPGIPEEIKPKLFEPNFSTKTEGMGLGLAIVKKTIDDLRGTIRLESAVGGGTEVTITIPSAPE
jgi:signal transduction histidine kinase